MKLSSINNEKVVNWAKLKMKKYRDIEHLFLVEGTHLVEEALKRNIVVEISHFPLLTFHLNVGIQSVKSGRCVMADCASEDSLVLCC